MAKKNSQIGDDELYEPTEQKEVGDITPDTLTIDNDEQKTVTDPVTPDSEIPNDVTPNDTSDTDLSNDDDQITDKNPDPDPVTPNDKEPVKLNEFKRFNIRFGYSIDSRSVTTRRTLSTTEVVKQFVKAPTCFIAFETKEDLKDFETILKAKTIKVEDKEGKLVDFSDAAKKHLVERVTELSKYWIARNSK